MAGSQHEGKQIFGLLAPSGCFVEEFSVTAPVKTSKVSPEKELKIPHEILSILNVWMRQTKRFGLKTVQQVLFSSLDGSRWNMIESSSHFICLV